MLHGRILIVDDNEVNQLVACAMLDHWSVSYKCASDGKEAVKIWQRLNPDLILMDIQMPICDGYKATKQIRQLEQGDSRIPIIAITASDEGIERDKCLMAGMDDFINKPFDQEDLYTTLKKWLT